MIGEQIGIDFNSIKLEVGVYQPEKKGEKEVKSLHIINFANELSVEHIKQIQADLSYKA